MAGDFIITVDVANAVRALGNLADTEVPRRMRGALNESLGYLQALVQENTPVGVTGQLRSGIFTEIRGSAMGLEGAVAPPAIARDYAAVMELGRRPGSKMPPPDAIRLWVQRTLGDASLAFVVARAIGRHGIRGRHMFEQAFTRGKGTVSSIFDRWFRL